MSALEPGVTMEEIMEVLRICVAAGAVSLTARRERSPMEHGNQFLKAIHQVVEVSALGVELLAVAVIVGGVLLVAIRRGTVRYLFRLGEPGAYESYKHQLGKPLLLGLELLVAADVVRTVVLEPTLANIVILGLLVLVRTLLSWSLTVEMEGRWPWSEKKQQVGTTGGGK
jgi:uncharacterized membrane protein